jgi:very-short-patch-repair endonuclease
MKISRPVITRILREHGVDLRSRSEAEFSKWRRIKQDPALVRRQCGAAWKAVLGSKKSETSKIAAAMSRCRRVGLHEEELAALLRERDLDVVEQLPVGPYNLDLAVESTRFAVEVIGSNSRQAYARMRERTEYLLDRGWTVVFVPLRTGPQHLDPGLPAIADEIVALSKIRRPDHAARGQYGVVGRHGKPTPFCRRELDGLPVIERARRADDGTLDLGAR